MADHEDDNSNNKINEPQSSYGAFHGKRISIFTSFEDAARAEALVAAQQSPIERLRETVELILRVYGVTREELNNRKKSNRITILQ
ncbi:MAG: hypothetical protein V4649_10915 [Bacteroidota bacterium]